MSIVDELISEKDVPVGTFLFSRSPGSLEVLAGAGYDFAVIGTEHFMANSETIERLVTVAEASDIVPIVRVGESVNMISRVLDCGARGILAPMINTVRQAREVVNAAKFPPIGERGVGNPRSTGYGVLGAEYMDKCYKQQNEDQAVIVQIETKKAVDNLTEIATVEGVDSLFIGPWDLAHSLERKGDSNREKLLEENIKLVLKQVQDIDVTLGIFSWDSADANRRIEQGFDYVVCAGDLIFLDKSARGELEEIRNNSGSGLES